MTVLAVDPSSKSCGCCLVSDDGRVIGYGVVRATRIGLMAERIEDAWAKVLDRGYGSDVVLACERATPQTRKDRFTDNFPVGMAAGLWIRTVGAYGKHELLLVKPSEWRRAMLPKGIKGRDAYKAAALQRANTEIGASGLPGPIEMSQKGWDDMADAICLGVYAARRAKR